MRLRQQQRQTQTAYEHSSANPAIHDALEEVYSSMYHYLTKDLGRDASWARRRAEAEVKGTPSKFFCDELEQAGIRIRGARVLDLGAGLGGLAAELACRGASVVAVEPGAAWRRIAARRLAAISNCAVFGAVGEFLPLADCSVDLIVSRQVLEHVKSPATVITECYRVLKPGGRLFITYENYLGFREPHYDVHWLPLLPKRLGALYLHLLGRKPTFLLESVTYTTFPSVRRCLLRTGFICTRREEIQQRLCSSENACRSWRLVKLTARINSSFALNAVAALDYCRRLCRTSAEESMRKPSGKRNGSYLFTIPWLPSSPIGGVNQSILGLIHQMRLGGQYEPLLAIINGPERPAQPAFVECPVISLRLRNPAEPKLPLRAPLAFLFCLPWTLLQLRKLVVSRAIHAIVHEFPSAEALNFVLLKVCGLFRGKVILALHGNDIKEAAESTGVRRSLNKLAFRLADCVVACSQGIRQDLLNFEPRCEKNSIVVYNAVAINSYESQHLDVARLPETTRGRRFLLNIGKFEYKKGHDTLLEAFEAIASSFPDVLLVLVGATGPKTNGIRKLVEASHFSERILMLENIPHEHVACYLKAASIFILPSRREGLPFAILEAAACKLPVVATSIPGVTEVITDGVTGRLVPAENPAELAEAISDLLSDAQRRTLLADGLFELVKTKFSWDTTYRAYITI